MMHRVFLALRLLQVPYISFCFLFLLRSPFCICLQPGTIVHGRFIQPRRDLYVLGISQQESGETLLSITRPSMTSRTLTWKWLGDQGGKEGLFPVDNVWTWCNPHIVGIGGRYLLPAQPAPGAFPGEGRERDHHTCLKTNDVLSLCFCFYIFSSSSSSCYSLYRIRWVSYYA